MLTLYLFAVGAAIGSFLNVLADRLPKGMKITGRSKCDYCKRTLDWIDLVPLLSFVFLGGRCRRCHKKLSLFYPLVELVTAVAFVFTWQLTAGSVVLKILYLVVVAILIAIFFADVKSQIIPDELQIALLLTTLLLKISLGTSVNLLLLNILEGIVVMVPILLIFLATRGRGMGFGDVKLAAIVGFLLGLLKGLIALYIAFITGAIVGAILLAMGRKKMKSKIAFGPFIVIGVMTMIYWGEPIVELVKQWYGI